MRYLPPIVALYVACSGQPGCKTDKKEATIVHLAVPDAARSPEEAAAVECAVGIAKANRDYREGSIVKASHVGDKWFIEFGPSSFPNTTRGGPYEVHVLMPRCELIRVLYHQ
jgi:hypothetical protein